MENSYENLSETIKNHLDSVTKSSGLPYNEESIKLITENWLDKKAMFESQVSALDMMEVESFEKDDERGALLLTYSGSLISIGSLIEEKRHVDYSSIKLRSDVPDVLVFDDAALAEDINIDDGVSFISGPIKKTSNILKIVVCSKDLDMEEQEKRIREATIFLTNGFVKLNSRIENKEFLAQFTMKDMIKYIANKNNITQKLAKTIIEDFLYMVESGVLLGYKVSLGRLGKMFLKKRAAQKAKIGVNPQTGEKITIPAKPEMYVPKINFSKMIKEKSANVPIEEHEHEDEDSDELE